MNENCQINFTNINNTVITLNILHSNTAKYQGTILNVKGKCKDEEYRNKQNGVGSEYRKLYWLLVCQSQIPFQNKVQIYNQIFKPTSTYGIQQQV